MVISCWQFGMACVAPAPRTGWRWRRRSLQAAGTPWRGQEQTQALRAAEGSPAGGAGPLYL
jgi:hypothetical protein